MLSGTGFLFAIMRMFWNLKVVMVAQYLAALRKSDVPSVLSWMLLNFHFKVVTMVEKRKEEM